MASYPGYYVAVPRTAPAHATGIGAMLRRGKKEKLDSSEDGKRLGQLYKVRIEAKTKKKLLFPERPSICQLPAKRFSEELRENATLKAGMAMLRIKNNSPGGKYANA